RLTEVDALVRSQGTPWFARYGFSKDELAAVRAAEGWHLRYGASGPSRAVSGSAAEAPGKVH
ncbi:MAG: tagatose-bisphosphate aldolase, partial [Isosphaeraceae bacterium]